MFRGSDRPGGLPWIIWHLLVELLALPFALVFLPFVSLDRATGRARDWTRLIARERETRLMCQQYRLAGRQARSFLAEHLAAQENLERTFLQQHYRTPVAARRGYELLQLAQSQLLEQAHRMTESPIGESCEQAEMSKVS